MSDMGVLCELSWEALHLHGVWEGVGLQIELLDWEALHGAICDSFTTSGYPWS